MPGYYVCQTLMICIAHNVTCKIEQIKNLYSTPPLAFTNSNLKPNPNFNTQLRYFKGRGQQPVKDDQEDDRRNPQAAHHYGVPSNQFI